LKTIIYICLYTLLLILNSCKVENKSETLDKSNNLWALQQLTSKNMLSPKTEKSIVPEINIIKQDSSVKYHSNVNTVKTIIIRQLNKLQPSSLLFAHSVSIVNSNELNLIKKRSHVASYSEEKHEEGNIYFRLALIFLIIALLLVVISIIGANVISLDLGGLIILALLALLGSSLVFFILGLIFHK